jgi:hypothetical protein
MSLHIRYILVGGGVKLLLSNKNQQKQVLEISVGRWGIHPVPNWLVVEAKRAPMIK